MKGVTPGQVAREPRSWHLGVNGSQVQILSARPKRKRRIATKERTASFSLSRSQGRDAAQGKRWKASSAGPCEEGDESDDSMRADDHVTQLRGGTAGIHGAGVLIG